MTLILHQYLQRIIRPQIEERRRAEGVHATERAPEELIDEDVGAVVQPAHRQLNGIRGAEAEGGLVEDEAVADGELLEGERILGGGDGQSTGDLKQRAEVVGGQGDVQWWCLGGVLLRRMTMIITS